ncbi:hypothetical protein TNCV_1903751 [Trichonephila clavipes]|nr:hypothetical protein TNCV_1903751 [Trichonephila clavipes]
MYISGVREGRTALEGQQVADLQVVFLGQRCYPINGEQRLTGYFQMRNFSLIAGKEFRNWVLGVTKRRINNSGDDSASGNIQCVPRHRCPWARDGMCWDRRGQQRDNRSKEPSPTGAEKEKTSEDD